MLTGLLWMVMAWQQGQATKNFTISTIGRCPIGQEPAITIDLNSPDPIGEAKEECVISYKPEPFDVPPVEEKEQVEYGSVIAPEPAIPLIHCEASTTFSGRCYYETTVQTCKDKSRFLLMDQSGKWHCLALGQKP